MAMTIRVDWSLGATNDEAWINGVCEAFPTLGQIVGTAFEAGAWKDNEFGHALAINQLRVAMERHIAAIGWKVEPR